jgi:hypothetical protein
MSTILTSSQGTLLPLHPPTTPTALSTAWMPLDVFIQAWATFSAQATSAPVLTATGMAFLALSCETSALHHRTWAYQLLLQVQQQRQRLWTLMQELQEDLLAYGQHGAEGLGHLRECSPSGNREEGIR